MYVVLIEKPTYQTVVVSRGSDQKRLVIITGTQSIIVCLSAAYEMLIHFSIIR